MAIPSNSIQSLTVYTIQVKLHRFLQPTLPKYLKTDSIWLWSSQCSFSAGISILKRLPEDICWGQMWRLCSHIWPSGNGSVEMGSGCAVLCCTASRALCLGEQGSSPWISAIQSQKGKWVLALDCLHCESGWCDFENGSNSTWGQALHCAKLQLVLNYSSATPSRVIVIGENV